MAPKNKDEEDVKLENMEELLSYFEVEPKTKRQVKPDLDNFSLVTFLETDGARLDKLNKLFGDKLANHRSFNQTKKLVEDQEKHNSILETELCVRLSPIESTLNQELSKLWNSLHKKN